MLMMYASGMLLACANDTNACLRSWNRNGGLPIFRTSLRNVRESSCGFMSVADPFSRIASAMSSGSGTKRFDPGVFGAFVIHFPSFWVTAR